MADIIVRIAPNATMLDAVDALSAGDVGVVAVMERGKVLGVVSERTLSGAIAHRKALECDARGRRRQQGPRLVRRGFDGRRGRERDDPDRYIRHVLVERAGKLVGIVSARDLLGFYAFRRSRQPDHYFG